MTNGGKQVETASSQTLVIPRSFELYIDGAKWILAIVSGLLAFGFNFITEHPGDSAAFVAYAVTGGALSLCAGATAVYLWASHSYLALREGGQAGESMKRCSDWSYIAMLATFVAGIVCFAVFSALLLNSQRKPNDIAPVMIGFGDGVLFKQGDRFWILERRCSGKRVWTPVVAPGSAVTVETAVQPAKSCKP